MTKEQEKLVVQNLRLVKWVLGRMVRNEYHRGILLAFGEDDAFQIGCIALMKAAQAWDPNRGAAFSTLAVYYIRGHLFRALHRRRHTRKHSAEVHQLVAEEEIEEDSNPFLDIEDHEWLVHHMQYLRDKDRHCVQLVFLDGKTNKEVAALYGVSPQAITRRIRRAIAELKVFARSCQ